MYLDLLYKAIGLDDGVGYNGCEKPMAFVVYDEEMIYQITFETERDRFNYRVNIMKVDTDHVMSPALCLVLKWLCILFNDATAGQINHAHFIATARRFGFEPDYEILNGRINYYR